MCFLPLRSQNIKYTYRNFDDRDGIQSSVMFQMAQDKDGFIWMGTDNGLHRYDGHRFVVIKSPLDNPSHNISNEIREIMYDEKYNRLWLLSQTDFQYLDLNDYTFHRWLDSSHSNINLISSYKFIVKLNPDEILCSIDGNIYQYGITSKKVKELTTEFALPSDIRKTYTILQKPDKDHLFLIYPNYLIIQNLNNGKLKYIKASDNEVFSDVAYDSLTKNYYIAAHHGLIRLDLKTGKTQKTIFPYTVKNRTFYHIIHRVHLFDQNTLILSGMSGHILYNMRTKIHRFFPPEKGDFENRVSASYFLNDREGNLWRSSIHHYCNVLYHQNKKMLVIDSIQSKFPVNIEPYRNVRLDTKSFAFCGSGMTGFGMFDQETGKYQVIENPLNTIPVVFDILVINQNAVYTATRHDLFFYEPVTKKFMSMFFEIDGKKQRLPGIHYMIKTGEKSLAAITANAIYLLDTDQKKGIKTDISGLLNEKRDQTGYGMQPFILYRNKIYLGGGKFLYEFDLSSKIIRMAWEKDKQLSPGLLRFVSDIIEDPNGRLWMSTLNNGVILHDPAKGTWKNINKDNSRISSNNVNGLILDPKNRMWLMNIDRSYLFDINSLECITSKDKREGFPRLGYSANLEKGDHIMTFNNYPFIQVLDFDKNPINLSTRPTLITSVSINEKELLTVPLKSDTSFTFSHEKNNLSFSFTNLCFNNSHHNQYKYKLDGIDTSWTVSHNAYANYTRLPSGSYTFKLLSSNNEGIWHPHVQNIKFTIRPVFYKSWWFVTLSFISLSGLIFFYYRQKTNRIRSEEKLKSEYQKKISEIELKALRAQMNPHFIFNSLNSIQKFIFEKDEYAASQYLTKFSRLIRLILDQSNQDFITLSSEFDLLKYYLEMEKLRFTDIFSYEFIVDKEINHEWMIPSMVIQPHVENAIWHGLLHKEGKGNLTIEFRKSEVPHTVIVIITDNGVGRTKAAELKSKQTLKKKSYGSSLSEERIRNINTQHNIHQFVEITDLKDKNGEASGTQVKLFLYASSLNHTN